MKIIDMIIENFPLIFINTILFLIVSMFLYFSNFSFYMIGFIFIIWFIPLISNMIIRFIKSKRYYDKIEDILNSLDRKYLLPELINEPQVGEKKALYNILKEANKSMHENVKYYKDMQDEYREYIETWVHEIKTPIASSKLIIDNNDNRVTDRIDMQLDRIENFVEQVLYYSRSNDVSKDYIINKFQIEIVVNAVIRRNSREFIAKKISLDIRDVSNIVYSDIKWVEFILNQIIGNSIKYCKKCNSKICIYTQQDDRSVRLIIEDNGIGISDKDIGRVFQKGFTGGNGRKFSKATGMGLYLSKKLCVKLGIAITLQSIVNEGTKITIRFPIGTYSNFDINRTDKVH